MSKIVLSLDVSSVKTGYAVCKNGRWRLSSTSHGVICPPKKFGLSEKLVYLRDELEKVILSVGPDRIVIEDVFASRNISTMKLLSRFNGVAIELSRRLLGKNPDIVMTAQVRSFHKCGRSKEEAFEFIKEKYKLDWKFEEMNDITDAIAMGLYASKVLGDI